MTPIFLQDALVSDMKELLADIRSRRDPDTGDLEPEPFRVYPQYIPPRKRDRDYSIYPFCRVVLGDGSDDDDDATQEVVLVFASRDDSEDMQGYRDILNAIQKVRERYSKRPHIANMFEVKSMKWLLDDERYPEYYGAVLLKVDIPQIEIDSEYT